MQSYIWFEEINELFFRNKDFEDLCNELELQGIKELEEELLHYQALDVLKFNHKEFYRNNNKKLSLLLNSIVQKKFSNENTIKMAVLERLISKGRELNFKDNQTQMVILLEKLLFFNKKYTIYCEFIFFVGYFPFRSILSKIFLRNVATFMIGLRNSIN